MFTYLFINEQFTVRSSIKQFIIESLYLVVALKPYMLPKAMLYLVA